MVCRTPTDQHIVPVAIFDVAVAEGPRHGVDVGVPTDGDLVTDAAGCEGSAGVEEVRVIAGHVSDVGVLEGIKGDAEAVVDPDRAVAVTNASDRLRPTCVILEHERQTICAVGVATKIDVEGGLEVVGKIDALVEHRRTRSASRVRRQTRRCGVRCHRWPSH